MSTYENIPFNDLKLVNLFCGFGLGSGTANMGSEIHSLKVEIQAQRQQHDKEMHIKFNLKRVVLVACSERQV